MQKLTDPSEIEEFLDAGKVRISSWQKPQGTSHEVDLHLMANILLFDLSDRGAFNSSLIRWRTAHAFLNYAIDVHCNLSERYIGRGSFTMKEFASTPVAEKLGIRSAPSTYRRSQLKSSANLAIAVLLKEGLVVRTGLSYSIGNIEGLYERFSATH